MRLLVNMKLTEILARIRNYIVWTELYFGFPMKTLHLVFYSEEKYGLIVSENKILNKIFKSKKDEIIKKGLG
jgi:hypothetical protein